MKPRCGIDAAATAGAGAGWARESRLWKRFTRPFKSRRELASRERNRSGSMENEQSATLAVFCSEPIRNGCSERPTRATAMLDAIGFGIGIPVMDTPFEV